MDIVEQAYMYKSLRDIVHAIDKKELNLEDAIFQLAKLITLPEHRQEHRHDVHVENKITWSEICDEYNVEDLADVQHARPSINFMDWLEKNYNAPTQIK